MVMFAIPLLFMVVCYFVVIQELWMSTKTIADLTKSGHENTNGSKTNTIGGNVGGGSGHVTRPTVSGGSSSGTGCGPDPPSNSSFSEG